MFVLKYFIVQNTKMAKQSLILADNEWLLLFFFFFFTNRGFALRYSLYFLDKIYQS